MVTVPELIPVAIPLSEPTLTADVLLIQEPPGTTSLSVVAAPAHTDEAPDIGPGDGLTVATFVVRQPVGSV